MINNILCEIGRLADKIKRGKIFSSTDVVISSIRSIGKLVSKVRDDETLKNIYPIAVRELIQSRQTSALLLNSLRELTKTLVDSLEETRDLREISTRINLKVHEIEKSIRDKNRTVAKIASNRILDGDTILVNSYSTVVYEAISYAISEGKKLSVYIPESRPGNEGVFFARKLAKLTNVTLFVDSAVRHFMKDVDKVFTSAEAIAANGALINKVGTSIIALVAHEARVRFFSLAATTKFYPETFLGELVELNRISLKLEEEGRDLEGKIDAYSPLFDVTPPEYIDAIITEKGLIAPQAVVIIIQELYGWPPKIPSLESEFIKLQEVIG
ncbi:MAG: hypothetical protein DRJ35_02965 [Thermoprotei archaeon]|nr:MAG: hypothetical protein DRJ35_02965 [Thermoprotei archaeon]